MIVNARVAIDPAVLEAEVKRVVASRCTAVGVTAEFRTSQSLRPGRPVPTHRYAEAKHWFAERDRPEYHAASSEEAWERTTRLLAARLGPGAA